MIRPSILGFFCEDIREEKNDLTSLMGVFPDHLNVATPDGQDIAPGKNPIVPRLSFYIRFNFDADSDLPLYEIRIVLANGNVLSLGSLAAELVSKAKSDAKEKRVPFAGIVMKGAVMNLPLVEPGFVRIEVQDRDEIELVGGVFFNFTKVSTSPTA